MFKILINVVLYYSILSINVFSMNINHYNCSKTEYKKIKNLKNILENDINMKIYINKECRLYTKKIKKINLSEKELIIYKDIINLK